MQAVMNPAGAACVDWLRHLTRRGDVIQGTDD